MRFEWVILGYFCHFSPKNSHFPQKLQKSRLKPEVIVKPQETSQIPLSFMYKNLVDENAKKLGDLGVF